MAFALYKPVSWTPLDAIRALTGSHPKLAYAGRLDPMAEGVLLVLEGDENRDPTPYRLLDKQYLVRVLFGVGTDSDDALGRIVAHECPPRIEHAALETRVRATVGTFVQRVARFSAAKVGGKPLYWWARHGRVDEVRAPAYERTIFSAELSSMGEIHTGALHAMVDARVRAVRGDFRQDTVLADWARTLEDEGALPWASVRVHCSSGTFMRSYARALGDALGVPALALEIVRERVGPYTADLARRIDRVSTHGTAGG